MWRQAVTACAVAEGGGAPARRCSFFPPNNSERCSACAGYDPGASRGLSSRAGRGEGCASAERVARGLASAGLVCGGVVELPRWAVSPAHAVRPRGLDLVRWAAVHRSSVVRRPRSMAARYRVVLWVPSCASAAARLTDGCAAACRLFGCLFRGSSPDRPAAGWAQCALLSSMHEAWSVCALRAALSSRAGAVGGVHHPPDLTPRNNAPLALCTHCAAQGQRC